MLLFDIKVSKQIGFKKVDDESVPEQGYLDGLNLSLLGTSMKEYSAAKMRFMTEVSREVIQRVLPEERDDRVAYCTIEFRRVAIEQH